LELLKDGSVLESESVEDGDTVVFDGLDEDYDYELRLRAEIDVNDGEGASDTILDTGIYTSVIILLPEITLEAETISESRIVWSIDTTALEGIAEPSSLEIKVFDDVSDELLTTSSLAKDNVSFEVEGLYANQSIRLEIHGTYDLEDGRGEQEGLMYEDYVTTSENQKPTGSVNSMDLHQDSIDFSVSLNDPFSTAVADTFVARLYAEDEDRTLKAEKTLNGGGSYTFEDLSVYKDYAYSIEIYIDYNLRDGEGDHADHYLDSKYAKANTRAKAPVGEIEEWNAGQDSVTFAYTVLDNDETIVEDGLKAFINGEEVALENLSGTETLSELLSGKEYTLRLVAEYNLGDGVTTEELATATFTTEEKSAGTGEIVDVEKALGEFGVTVALDDKDETFVNGAILELLKDGSVLESESVEDGDTVVFDGLDEDYDYELRLRAEIDVNDGEGASDTILDTGIYTSVIILLPEITLEAETISESRIVWSIDTTALEGIAEPSSLEIKVFDDVSDELLTTSSLAKDNVSFEVEGLYANQSIRLEIHGTYDLEDGRGEQEGLMYEDYVTTSENQKPTGSVNSMDLHQDSIDFSVSLNDPFSTAVADTFVARLYAEDEDRTLKAEKTLNGGGSYTFEDLSVYKDYAYSIEIYIDYNLRDGEGDHADHYLDSKYAKANTRAKAPVGEIEEWNAGQDSVTFAYTVLDNDETIVEDGLKAFINGEEVALENLSGTETLSELLSGKEYTLRLVAEYNLGDGVTTEELATATFTTEEKSAGTGEIVDVEKALGKFSVSVALSDEDETFANGAVLELLKDGSVLESESVEDGDTVLFENLQPNAAYELSLRAEMDLNDGEGGADVLLHEVSHTTFDGVPDTSVLDPDIGKEAIAFDVAFDNVYENVDEDSLMLVLYGPDGEKIAERSFADEYYYILRELYSDQEYTARFYGDIDFADGEGVQEEFLLHEETFTTLALTFPIPEMGKPYIDGDQIAIDLGAIEDDDEVYTEDDMRLVLYEIVDGEANELESIAIDIDDAGDSYTFAEIYDEEKTYRISLEASYDLNHPEGLYEDEVLDSITFNTIAHKE